MTPTIDADKCAACGKCIDACPERAIIMNDGHPHVNELLCVGCGLCLLQCPCGAVETENKGEDY